MRPSANRHVLSVLRKLLGDIEQWRLAELVGCSVETVRKIEKGRLKMSKMLATRVAIATGVDEEWLLKNDLNAPPTSNWTESYDKNFFDSWHLLKSTPLAEDLVEHLPDIALSIYMRMRAILSSAALKGERYVSYLLAEVTRVLDQGEREFGSVKAIENHPRAGYLNAKQLWLIERDVLLVRSHIEREFGILSRDPVPPAATIDDLEAYRAWRREHELPKAR